MEFLLKVKDVLTGGARDVPSERRDTPRIVCPIDGVCVNNDGSGFSVVISDIGLYGMRLEVLKPIAVGHAMQVRVLRGQGILALHNFEIDTIQTTALWCRRVPGKKAWHVGARYADTRRNLNNSWVKFIFQKFGINIGASVQRRKDIRLPSHVPVEVVGEDGGPKAQAEAINMGIGGILLATTQEYRDRGRVKMKIGPMGRLPALSMAGTVVKKRISKKGKLWLLGVQFHGASYEDSKLLTKYLLKIIAEGGQPEETEIL